MIVKYNEMFAQYKQYDLFFTKHCSCIQIVQWITRFNYRCRESRGVQYDRRFVPAIRRQHFKTEFFGMIL